MDLPGDWTKSKVDVLFAFQPDAQNVPTTLKLTDHDTFGGDNEGIG
jgi:hypothetical protein